MNGNFSSIKQKQINDVIRYIGNAGEKNISEKRNNFQHLTLLISTILGFSAGLVATTGGKPNCFLLLSWLVDVLVIALGSAYLIIEAESRYFRTFIVAEKQLSLTQAVEKADEAHSSKIAKEIFSDIHKKLFDIKTGETFKEKLFIAFARYQTRIEVLFYLTFLLALALLVISFI